MRHRKNKWLAGILGTALLLGVLLVVIFGVWGTNYDAQAFIYFQF